MEEKKANKSKNKILKFIPKALSFQNPPFSPSRDKDVRFSGPIFVTREARGRRTPRDREQEPTSPKVSCLGQIKQRRHNKKKEDDAAASNWRKVSNKMKNNKSKERVSSIGVEAEAEAAAPVLVQMRRYTSSRGGSLSNFDWTAQVMPEDSHQRDEDGEVRILFSAPLGAGGEEEMRLQPKKEINIWKRRTMAPPRPLSIADS